MSARHKICVCRNLCYLNVFVCVKQRICTPLTARKQGSVLCVCFHCICQTNKGPMQLRVCCNGWKCP